MNEGRFVAEFTAAEATQERIVRAIVRAEELRSMSQPDAQVVTAAVAAGPGACTRASSQNNLREYGMLISLVAIMVLFRVLTDGTLLRPLNLTNLLRCKNGYVVIMALGMLLVIVAGHIDLSVGSVSGFIGALAAVLMVEYEWHFVADQRSMSILAGALIGAGAGPGSWPSARFPRSSSHSRACWCSRGSALAAARRRPVGVEAVSARPSAVA